MLNHPQWNIITGIIERWSKGERDADYSMGMIEYGFRLLKEARNIVPKPVAWVIGFDNNANDRGFIDAMAWSEGEFTTPLFAEPHVVAELNTEAHIARLTEALKSISANTCCDNCREAANVARAALASYIGLAREGSSVPRPDRA